MYSENTVYVIGDAKAAQHNPITKQYSQYFLALVINFASDEIVDCECSSTVDLTNRFVRSLFIGRHIDDEHVEEQLRRRYLGASQKALIVAFHDARQKYEQSKAALIK